MGSRRYYSTRTGKNPNAAHFDLETLKRLFLAVLANLWEDGYFWEAFGYEDASGDWVRGTIADSVERQLLLRIRKPLKYKPLETHIEDYSEDDVFDLIEFHHDYVSKPLEYDGAFLTFDKKEGQRVLREQINIFLADYQSGYQLSENGEILALADPGLQPLLDALLPQFDPVNVEKRVEAAIRKYRRHHSSLDDRKDAVRDLADVLEFLRPKAEQYLLTKKDEGALLGIANNFAIRHHDGKQQSDYNKAIWYSWMFYFYLATIQAAVRVIQENEARQSSS